MSENRDRELENLIGQYLVATFQADKLAELIRNRMTYSDKKKLEIFLQNSDVVVTIEIKRLKLGKIEP